MQTLSYYRPEKTKHNPNAGESSRSQFVTLKRRENTKYLPYTFTEYSALMAANRSPITNHRSGCKLHGFAVANHLSPFTDHLSLTCPAAAMA